MIRDEQRKPDGGLSAWIETMEAMGSGSEDAELLCLLLELRRRRENEAKLPDGWVKCSDRMPEEDTLCFAIDEDEVIWTAHYDEGVLNPDIGGEYCKPTFTHWMTHPSPPTDSTT